MVVERAGFDAGVELQEVVVAQFARGMQPWQGARDARATEREFSHHGEA